MTNNTTASGKTRWLLLPIILIAGLSALGFIISIEARKERKAQGELKHIESPEENSFFTSFTPKEIMEMVNEDADGIAGRCKSKGFNINGNVFEWHQNQSQTARESIMVLDDASKTLIYSFELEGDYKEFANQLRALDPVSVLKERYNKNYSTKEHFLKDSCVFIKDGFDRSTKVWSFVATKL